MFLRTTPSRNIVPRLALGIALLATPRLVLAQAPVARLDTVRVTVASHASPSLATATRTVDAIGREEIARSAARTLAELLASRLAVDVTRRSPAQADIALRGSSVEQVLVLVDGVRASDAQSAHYDLDLAVPLDLVERIEVLRGTGSTLYGSDAVGGVINIVTRRDRAFGSAGVSGGSFGTATASLGAGQRLGGIGLQAGADADHSDGHRPGTEYRIVQARAGVSRAIGAGELRAELGTGTRSFGAAGFYAPYPSRERTETNTATLRYASGTSGPWGVTATAHARLHTDRFTLIRDRPQVYENDHRSWQTGGDVVTRYAPSRVAVLALGAEVRDDRLRSSGLGERHDEARAVFADATVGSTRRGTLQVGARADRAPRMGWFASPSVAASVPVTGALRLRGSLARAFRVPTWTELYYRDPSNAGNPALHPETFTAGEVGLLVLPSRRFTLDVALFARRAEELIDWAKPAGAGTTEPWRTMNFARGTHRGVEVSVDAPGLLGIDWKVRATGLTFDVAGAEGYAGKYALRPLTRSIAVMADAPLVAGARASVDVRHFRRAGDGPHEEANVRLAREWGRIAVDLRMLNLTSAQYLDASGMMVAGRSGYGGVRVRL